MIEMSLRVLRRYVRRVVSPIPDSYGPHFAKQYKFLQSSQWQPFTAIQDYQSERLRDLIIHCYANVPYYRTLFDSHGLSPKDFQTAADLSKLPLLTKETIRENAQALLARNVPLKEREYHTTGGTSGAPLGLWIEERSNALRWAFDWRFHGWVCFLFKGL